MSFEYYMKPLLNQPPDDTEWYVRATYTALNSYMEELEHIMEVPKLMVNGTIVVPGAAATYISGPFAYFIPIHKTITFQEVKSAMWCGDGTMCFVNLFNLFGKKFKQTFITLQALPFLNITAAVNIPTTTFETCAYEFLSNIKAIGPAMNPDIFLNLESTYLIKALTTIPPITVSCIGSSLTPPGTFTGTVTVSFAGLV